jgi:hypothetical protein
MQKVAPKWEFTLMKPLSVTGMLIQHLFFSFEIDLCGFQSCDREWKSCQVVQSRKTTKALSMHLRRWIRTLNFNTVDIDGNPNHPLYGGILGLANSHSVGSLLNHSRLYVKCTYEWKDLVSADLKTTDGTRRIGGMFVHAERTIYKHEHLLTNYEAKTASEIESMLLFV